MATIRELRAAMERAVQAGDTEAARMFADDIKERAGLTEYSPTGTFGENLMAGVGRSFAQTGRGIGQLMGTTTQQEIEEAQRLDQPLMETGGGITGNILGSMAQMPFPITTIPRAAAAGATFEALQPGTPGERAQSAAMGGLLGVGGQVAGEAIGRAVHPVRGTEPAAEVLQAEGIPLSPGDITGSRALNAIESTVGQMPGAAGRAQTFREAQQAAFNRAALSRAGIQADAATEDVINSAYDNFSSQYGRLIGPRQVELGDEWWQGLYSIDEANRTLLPSLRSPKVDKIVDDMMEMTERPVPAQQLQATRSALAEMERTLRQSGKKPELRNTLNRVINTMDDAVENSLPGQQATALRQLRRQYANLKQIEPVIDEVGDISPARLNQKLKSRDKTGYARGRGDLTELAKAGKRVLPEKLPQSGTAERQLIQAALGGGAGASPGLLMGDPMAAVQGMMAGAAAPAAAANVAYRGMMSPAGTRYLSQGIPGPGLLDSPMMRVLSTTGAIGAGSSYREENR